MSEDVSTRASFLAGRYRVDDRYHAQLSVRTGTIVAVGVPSSGVVTTSAWCDSDAQGYFPTLSKVGAGAGRRCKPCRAVPVLSEPFSVDMR